MTFPEFITTLRQADAQATKGPLPCPFCGVNPTRTGVMLDSGEPVFWCDCLVRSGEAIIGVPLIEWNRRVSRNSLAQTIAIMEVARKALARISNPLAALQNDALEAGNKLNGPMALQIASDPEYLKSLATAALASIDALAAKTP